MRAELAEMIRKENAKQTEAEEMKEETHRLKKLNHQYFQQATAFNAVFEEHKALEERKNMLEKNRNRMKDGMTVLKGESVV